MYLIFWGELLSSYFNVILFFFFFPFLFKAVSSGRCRKTEACIDFIFVPTISDDMFDTQMAFVDWMKDSHYYIGIV